MAWREVLDDYAHHLDLVELAIDGKARWPGDFVPTGSLDGMPRNARGEANELVRRTSELASRLSHRMDEFRKVLDISERRDPTGRVVLVDVKA